MSIVQPQTVPSENEIPEPNPYTSRHHGGKAVHANIASGALDKEAIYVRAARQMHYGKILVISGFGILLAGIITYCVVGVAAEPSQDFGMTFLASSSWLLAPAQIAIAIGTLLWLIGAFLHLLGALDSDPAGPELYF